MKKFFGFIKRFAADTDFVLLILSIVASAFGVLMVHSATLRKVADGATLSRDTRTMILAVGLGLALSLVVSLIDYNLIIRSWPVLAVFCIGIMILLYFIGVGPDARSDAKTWIELGSSGLYFQPSELVKIGFIITFGMHLELVHDRLASLPVVIGLCLHAAVPTLLVAVSGDMGSALIFIVIFLGMMFMSGLKKRYFAAGAAIVAVSVPFVWKFVLKDLQKMRFLALMHPEDYPDAIYQQKNCITAIGAGKLTGMGLFNGSYTQSGMVPENENDMILSVIGEELGFVGCVAALALLTAVVLRVIRTGKKAGDRAAAIMCYGFASMLLGHIVVNVGMCLMLLPVVGITLPFFSAGGSSNLCLYIGLGLVLSIYRYSKEHEAVNFRLNGIHTPFTE